ncbi:MAG: two-component regulator propeller domain-containing protein [Balneolaceae bacterium]
MNFLVLTGFTFLMLLFSLQGVLFAQSLPFRTYSIEQGLSESVANDMLQDREGYLWVATGYGLNRLDGVSVRSYYQRDGLRDNQINTLYEDSDGNLWVGTAAGVNRMERDSVHSVSWLSGLDRYSVTSILQDSQGEWWFGTATAGVWLLDRNRQLSQFSTVHGMAGNSVRKIIQTEDETLWFATGSGLTSLSSGNFNTYTTMHGLPSNDIHDMAVGEGNRLWIATEEGLSHLEDGGFTNYGEVEGLEDLSLQSVTIQGSDRVWLGTHQGASLLEEGRFQHYTTGHGLSSNIVYSTLVDREGHLWFGTMGGGVNIFSGDYFQNFTVDEGLSSDVVTSFTEDEAGDLWISSYGGGVMRYDGDEIHWLFAGDGLVDNKVFTLYRDLQHRIWVGARDGISLIDGGEIVPVPDHIPELQMVRAFFEDPESGDFWIGTYNEGLFRYDGVEWHTYNDQNVLENNTVMSIVQDSSGRLWIATYGGVTLFENGEFTTYTIEHGLPGNGVIHIHLDRNDVPWFSTFSGFARWSEEGIESFESGFGLSETITYFTFQDEMGLIWVGTNIGLVRFDPERYRLAENELERELAFRLVTKEEGLISNEMNAGAVYRDAGGSMWLGSVEGASRFYPDRLPGHEHPPLVHLSEVIMAGEPVDPEQSYRVAHERNFIEFEFIGISFEAPSRVMYEYRMDGLDPDWNRGYSRIVRYPSLSPGEYRFEVRAYNSAGIRSGSTASFSFEILPPFWMQWWFILLILLIIAGTIYLIYNYFRVHRMMEIERMRVQIASDLHDDVGASLTELALQTDFLRTGGDREEVAPALARIGEQSRMIVSAMDDIVWSIDARNDTVGDLTDRMQDHLLRILNPDQISARFDFSGTDPGFQLPVRIKENLYLIFKEAVNNIAKHSDADSVVVTLKLSPAKSDFRFEIRDNGTSSEVQRKSGQGLQNMKMRAERMGATTIIDAENGYRIIVTGSIP